jgi:mono/diheme cytochrome c family protein
MRVFVRIFAVLLAVSLFGGCKRGAGPADPRAEAKALFDSACGKCHGSDGRGGVPSMEGQPAPRNFNDAAFQASRSDAQLKQVIVAGKGAMPPYGKLFDEQQLAGLVAHIRGFNPKK